jgi:hypothetical protein
MGGRPDPEGSTSLTSAATRRCQHSGRRLGVVTGASSSKGPMDSSRGRPLHSRCKPCYVAKQTFKVFRIISSTFGSGRAGCRQDFGFRIRPERDGEHVIRHDLERAAEFDTRVGPFPSHAAARATRVRIPSGHVGCDVNSWGVPVYAPCVCPSMQNEGVLLARGLIGLPCEARTCRAGITR